MKFFFSEVYSLLTDFSLDKKPNREKAIKISLYGGYFIFLFTIIQGILLVPLYLNFLGERIYGLWLATGGMVSWLVFLDLGLASLIIQKTANQYGKGHLQNASKYFFNGFFIHIFGIVIVTSGGFASSLLIDRVFDLSNEELNLIQNCYFISLAALGLNLLNNGVEGFITALQKTLIPKIARIIAAILGIFSILLLLYQDYGLYALPIGILINVAVTFIFNFSYIIILLEKSNLLNIELDKNVLVEYLKLTPPIFIARFAGAVALNLEPIIIASLIRPELTVYYDLTKKGAAITKLLLDKFSGSFNPAFSHLFGEGNLEKSRKVFLSYIEGLFSLSLIGYCCYFLFNDAFIHYWVGSQNYLGHTMTILLAVSSFLFFFSNTLNYLLNCTGDFKYPAMISFFESILKIILIFVCIKLLGIIGLPIAIIFTSIPFLLINLARWKKNLAIKFDPNKFKKTLLLFLMLVIITASLKYWSFLINYNIFLLTLTFVVFVVMQLIVAMNYSFLLKRQFLKLRKLSFFKNTH